MTEFETALTPESGEMKIANEIVSVLRYASVRFHSIADVAISYSVRNPDLKLRSIVLDRHSLRRLLGDEDRAVKIEYLRRDLLRCAPLFSIYRYPRGRQ